DLPAPDSACTCMEGASCQFGESDNAPAHATCAGGRWKVRCGDASCGAGDVCRFEGGTGACVPNDCGQQAPSCACTKVCGSAAACISTLGYEVSCAGVK